MGPILKVIGLLWKPQDVLRKPSNQATPQSASHDLSTQGCCQNGIYRMEFIFRL